MNLAAIARSRSESLLALAKEVYPREPALALRYVQLARKIAMRHRLPLGRGRFCRKCGTVFIAAQTLKVRVSPSQRRVLYTCLSCNHSTSFPFVREKARRGIAPKRKTSTK